MDTMRIAVVQINSRNDKEANIRRAEELIDQAAATGARVVALPEYVNFLGPRDEQAGVPETVPGPITERFANKAKEHNIYVLGGSIHERSSTPDKSYNTSVLIDPSGEIIAKYRKIHLFDVDLPDGRPCERVGSVEPGDGTIVTRHAFGKLGLSVCYDLRFPELYRALVDRGAMPWRPGRIHDDHRQGSLARLASARH